MMISWPPYLFKSSLQKLEHKIKNGNNSGPISCNITLMCNELVHKRNKLPTKGEEGGVKKQLLGDDSCWKTTMFSVCLCLVVRINFGLNMEIHDHEILSDVVKQNTWLYLNDPNCAKLPKGEYGPPPPMITFSTQHVSSV